MKNMGKKHGTTFIEIVLALSIIGIISLAIFNNIFFSIKQNSLADKKQKNSIIGQMVYEEIKNISDEKFKDMLFSLRDRRTFSDLVDGFTDITNETINEKITKEINKKLAGEGTNYFKLYKENESDLYVLISFSGLDFTKENMGLNIKYPIKGKNDADYSDWIQESSCDASFTIEEENDLYKVIIKRKGIKTHSIINNLEIDQIRGQVLCKSKDIIIQNMGNKPITQEISGNDGAQIYINNNTDEKFKFILKNESNDSMKIYLNQKSSDNDNENGKIEFSSNGEKIQIFLNDSNANPFGENVKTSNVCKYKVSIFNEENGTVKNMSEIIGYKKFKRSGE